MGEKAGVAKACKIQENVKGGGWLWNKDILGTTQNHNLVFSSVRVPLIM